MPSVRIQRRSFLASAAGAILWPGSLRADGPPPATTPASRRVLPTAVADRCEALLARAVRSPYGFGWNEEVEGIDLNRARPKGRPPEINATLTASAGMLLHLVGETYAAEKFTAASIEAGRGLLAVQTRTGQIRSLGVMGAFGGTKDDAADVPDRRPTCAALATLLSILASQPKQDARLRGPSLKAAYWLSGQQSRAGGWPNLVPPDAAKGQGSRLLVLNQTDHRNAALVTLLGGEVLSGEDARGQWTPERQLHLSFTRAADMLGFCRLSAGLPPVRALWPTMCKLDGDALTRLESVPICVDLLSSRYALEVALAGYLVQQEGRFGEMLKVARDAISTLGRDAQQQWYHRYDTKLQPIVPPRPESPGVFGDPVPTAGPDAPTRTKELFAAIERVTQAGAKRSSDAWNAAMPMNRRLALVVSGFMPDALLTERGASDEAGPDAKAGGILGTIRSAWNEMSAAR
ncbi:hypothetical protein [Humisphaera borealis]|uniref:Uncharacterized protein n=1 Tax=Humisphaera borealis TaxID=2807512 RepID=A0A7M2WTC4_9BACT|nr:hypothetical protein [Humisphaera borealis]QOV88775.1 hypothetical protein IPV69_21485 [Humisphaera borealis]